MGQTKGAAGDQKILQPGDFWILRRGIAPIVTVLRAFACHEIPPVKALYFGAHGVGRCREINHRVLGKGLWPRRNLEEIKNGRAFKDLVRIAQRPQLPYIGTARRLRGKRHRHGTCKGGSPDHSAATRVTPSIGAR